MVMSKKEDETKEKFDVINRFLDDEYLVVHLDPSVEGVILPDYLLKNENITLKLSRLFRGGIEVNDEQIEATLSFNKVPFPCTLPLKAIWGVTNINNENIMWPDSMPIKYLKTIFNNQVKKPSAKKFDKKKTKLHRIK